MNKYANAQIAADEDLWDEYFNTSAFPENDFNALTYDERLELLNEAYPEE